MSSGVSSSPKSRNIEYLKNQSKSGLSSVMVALMTLSPWSSATGTGVAVGRGVGVGVSVGVGVRVGAGIGVGVWVGVGVAVGIGV